ncbi:hypothetical protein EDF73_102303 [Raoultella sp. BIGb0138]|nr:hypothetical protein EDF73_102303 [Raoultella sp. BIGb0138]
MHNSNAPLTPAWTFMQDKWSIVHCNDKTTS